jgi:hypothetical protein
VIERINIFMCMQWIAVLGVVLLRQQPAHTLAESQLGPQQTAA